MKSLIFLLSVLLVAVAERDVRIVNGQDAEEHAYPWQGSFRDGTSHICGCSLLNENWGITAAHCVGKSVTSYSAIWGRHHVNSNSGYDQVSTFSKIITHPEWSNSGSSGFPNDYALLKFKSPVTMTEYVNGIQVSDDDSEANVGRDNCFFSGWGRLSGGGATPNILQMTPANILTKSSCQSKWGSFIGDYHICHHDSKTSACNGDSGGPLVCKKGNTHTLVGVTSFGATGCLTSYPSVWARTAHVYDWITSNISE